MYVYHVTNLLMAV
uniref:Uncharacterized protein n=1 Tax=Zea mays TaxID=4577 RepID=C4IYU4_MAIZE|nr:unknown [Zea mays]